MIQNRVYIICNKCKAEFKAYSSYSSLSVRRKAKRNAEEAGWLVSNISYYGVHYCPNCRKEI